MIYTATTIVATCLGDMGNQTKVIPLSFSKPDQTQLWQRSARGVKRGGGRQISLNYLFQLGHKLPSEGDTFSFLSAPGKDFSLKFKFVFLAQLKI